MRNLNKEREILAQLYANDADVIKYLPFFFNNFNELKQFFKYFGGKTLKLPSSLSEYVKQYLLPDKYIKDSKCKGVKNINDMSQNILESYFNLFTSLEDVIKTECQRSDEIATD